MLAVLERAKHAVEELPDLAPAAVVATALGVTESDVQTWIASRPPEAAPPQHRLVSKAELLGWLDEIDRNLTAISGAVEAIGDEVDRLAVAIWKATGLDTASLTPAELNNLALQPKYAEQAGELRIIATLNSRAAELVGQLSRNTTVYGHLLFAIRSADAIAAGAPVPQAKIVGHPDAIDLKPLIKQIRQHPHYVRHRTVIRGGLTSVLVEVRSAAQPLQRQLEISAAPHVSVFFLNEGDLDLDDDADLDAEAAFWERESQQLEAQLDADLPTTE